MAWVVLALIVVVLAAIATYDLVQRKHAILRNFPLVGHLRYLLESIGPELRQYIVTDNDRDRPFSRDQRRWVYTSAKRVNSYIGFGTDNDLELSPGYLIIRPRAFPVADPVPPGAPLPCAKVLGAARNRPKAFRMASAVNISSMSYGSLGSRAVEALNAGAHLAGCLQGTGEGGLTPYHQRGGDLVWQLGTGYFGCRDPRGRFDLARFCDVVAVNPTIRAIEIKLSQGAKPGLGGVLPAAKVTREIAQLRGVAMDVDCISPPAHTAFRDVDSLLDFAELLADRTGLPIGVKTAVGDLGFFEELARLMADAARGIDFLAIDGGEGGTGAAPLAFADHVALPFKVGFSQVYRVFAEAGITDRLVFVGSGRNGLPASALLAFALGCDAVNVGREAMLAIGCVQAQRCHTGRCPTGVTTNSRWRQRGLDPALKSVRCANYIEQLRAEIIELAHACGEVHPALLGLEHLTVLDENYGSRSARDVFGYRPGWGLPSASQQADVRVLMRPG
jgi:glutamate synthase domain-containing protein 2